MTATKSGKTGRAWLTDGSFQAGNSLRYCAHITYNGQFRWLSPFPRPNLRHLTDAENQSPYKPSAWTYDARNLKLCEALPGHNPTSQIGDADYDKKEFSYDLAGRVEVATDQKGDNVTHLYDLASRLLQRDYRAYGQQAIADSDTFTYGDAGHMASAESGRYNNTVAFDYDTAGRLTSESLTITFGQTTTYTVQSAYDAANRRTGITYPDGSVVARQYTARDQLAQIDYNSGMVATFAYDAGSRRTSRTLGDTPGTQTAWVYGRQDNLPTAINSGVAGASFTYTYDANKNKLTEGISAPMANFGFNSTAYDPADRLTAWNRTDGNLDQAWNLSLVGNWATFTENQVQQTRTHTAVHEIAAIDATSVVHDATGNLTRNAGDTLDRYTWDFDNRLASADVDQDGTAECGYQYDALGRRVSKTVPDGEGSATMVFVGTIQALAHSPHAMQVLAEYAADAVPASPERKFVYAEYIDEPVMMARLDGPAETHYYYHQNSLYSVAAISDATGTVVEHYAYSAYGRPLFLDAAANLLDPQASTISNPYLFTGRRLDEETGLYYYRARMYDADLGRFVSRDPIDRIDPTSIYTYASSAPLGMLDPSGKIEYGPDGRPIYREEPQPSCPTGCRAAQVEFVVYQQQQVLEDDKTYLEVRCWSPSTWPDTPFTKRVDEWVWSVTEYRKQYLGTGHWRVTCVRDHITVEPCGDIVISQSPCGMVQSRVFGPRTYKEAKFYKRDTVRKRKNESLVNPDKHYFERTPSCADAVGEN